MNIKISDFVVEIEDNKELRDRYKKKGFITDSLPDFVVHVTEKDIMDDLTKLGGEKFRDRVTNLAIHRKIAEWLPLHGAFLLHSACFDVDGVGVAFAAHSGTGKTTHMLLWQQLLGDKMTVVNGDKPIVRFFEDEPETPYAYGTPWCGKERLGCNMRTPLKHICFIARSDKNSCEPMEKADAVNLIFNQVYMPKDPAAMMNTMQLIDRLLSCCKLWKIRCNMEPNAAETSFNAIFGMRNSECEMRNIDKPTVTV